MKPTDSCQYGRQSGLDASDRSSECQSDKHPLFRTYELTQGQIKRRRLNEPPGLLDNATREDPDDTPREDPDDAPREDPVTKFAEEYIQKIKKGLNKLDNKSQACPTDLDCEFLKLHPFEKSADKENDRRLETVLWKYEYQSDSEKWLADIYCLYIKVQHRYLNPGHLETSHNDEERIGIRKEMFCHMTNAMVNRLEPI